MNSARKPNGTGWSYLTKIWVALLRQYLRKGSTCYIEGQMQTRKWTDQQGVEKYTTEVVLQRYRGELTLLGGRGDSQMGGGSYAGGI